MNQNDITLFHNQRIYFIDLDFELGLDECREVLLSASLFFCQFITVISTILRLLSYRFSFWHQGILSQ